MDNFHDPFFRGCTRPAMLFGVPLMLMVLTSGAFMLAGAWGAFLFSRYVLLILGLLYLPLLLAMRAVTRQDDQRLRQLFLRGRMRWRMALVRLRWGTYSYSPCRYTLGG